LSVVTWSPGSRQRPVDTPRFARTGRGSWDSSGNTGLRGGPADDRSRRLESLRRSPCPTARMRGATRGARDLARYSRKLKSAADPDGLCAALNARYACQQAPACSGSDSGRLRANNTSGCGDAAAAMRSSDPFLICVGHSESTEWRHRPEVRVPRLTLCLTLNTHPPFAKAATH